MNILLLGSLILSGTADLVVLFSAIQTGAAHPGDSPLSLLIIFLIFLGLYIMSRNGYAVVSSYVLVALYVLPTTYALYRWGVAIPQGLLTYALAIVMAGVLISTRASVLLALNCTAIIIVLGYLQNAGAMHPDFYWQHDNVQVQDMLVFAATFLVMLLVSWLSNREIEKSLVRARRSEAALKQERDSLEIRVEERTRDLKQAQEARTREMYRFVDFGRMASGYMHDLGSPLTALSLHLRSLAKSKTAPVQVGQALQSLQKIDELNRGVQAQIQKQAITTVFTPAEQIRIALTMLTYKARESGVTLDWTPPKAAMQLTGNPLKFHRLITGLVDNAIDAYAGIPKERDNRRVHIGLTATDTAVRLTVRDWGCGILPVDLERIFEPLFTTKPVEHGTGIGLSLCKETVDDFGGTIAVESREGHGTTFTVTLPLTRNAQAPSSPSHASKAPQAGH